MYKIDDEFRPPGRVFMRATRETTTSDNSSSAVDVVPVRKSNLKSAITTNLDDRAIQFEHEVKHEKTIEALVTEYPSARHYAPPHHSNNLPQLMDSNSSRELVVHTRSGPNLAVQSRHSYYDNDPGVHKVVRNKRLATEVLGSSMETTQVAQDVPDGHRRLTTHMVRKITTMSRAEESAYPEGGNVVHRETKQFAYQSITDGGGPKKSKVNLDLVVTCSRRRQLSSMVTNRILVALDS